MNSIARRVLGAAAAAVARKLLPDAVPDNPGSALALRPPIGESTDRLLPMVCPSESAAKDIFYAAGQDAFRRMVTPPAPQPRRRRKVVVETVTYEEREW